MNRRKEVEGSKDVQLQSLDVQSLLYTAEADLWGSPATDRMTLTPHAQSWP